MHLAWERQARQIWIVNVGDLKPLEVPISHFMDMAYDFTPYSEPSSTFEWVSEWAEKQFGSEVAEDAAKVIDRYGFLTARRKYESVDSATYSVLNYNEADTILAEWKELSDAAQAIYDKLDADAQVGFFELVLHPVLAGYTVQQIHIYAGKNNVYSNQWRNSANDMAAQALKFFSQDASIKNRYDSLLGGKWKHMMDQTHLGYNWW